MPRGVYKRKSRKGPKRATAEIDFKPAFAVRELDSQPAGVKPDVPSGYVSADTYARLNEIHSLALMELAETRVEFLRLQLEMAMKERDELIAARKLR